MARHRKVPHSGGASREAGRRSPWRMPTEPRKPVHSKSKRMQIIGDSERGKHNPARNRPRDWVEGRAGRTTRAGARTVGHPGTRWNGEWEGQPERVQERRVSGQDNPDGYKNGGPPQDSVERRVGRTIRTGARSVGHRGTGWKGKWAGQPERVQGRWAAPGLGGRVSGQDNPGGCKEGGPPPGWTVGAVAFGNPVSGELMEPEAVQGQRQHPAPLLVVDERC